MADKSKRFQVRLGRGGNMADKSKRFRSLAESRLWGETFVALARHASASHDLAIEWADRAVSAHRERAESEGGDGA